MSHSIVFSRIGVQSRVWITRKVYA
jgi:hypothetical protein